MGKCWKRVLPENAFNLLGSKQAIYVENHREENAELCVGQRLGTVQCLCIDKEALCSEKN